MTVASGNRSLVAIFFYGGMGNGNGLIKSALMRYVLNGEWAGKIA